MTTLPWRKHGEDCGVVAVLRQLVTAEHGFLILSNAQTPGDRHRGARMIAGDHYRCNSSGETISDCLWHFGSRRIDQRHQPEKGQVPFDSFRLELVR